MEVVAKEHRFTRTPNSSKCCQAECWTNYREAHRASIGDTWRLFFTVELEKIVEYTRLKAQSLGADFQFDIVGLEAYIAICYFRGVSGDQKILVDVLWSEDASPFYNATMSKMSFKIWARFLRFDDFETREERKRLDTFAPFRDFWNYWNNRLRMFFIPYWNTYC